ncbi:MAG: hypothetical protein AAF215_06560 [Cyanobacteria bacterium P01_A01_bin.123]
MLVGIKAFEARWLELRSLYPTTAEENIIIAHAMGRLTDHYETAEEIIGTLPIQLRTLFQELMEAYLNGYTAKQPTKVSHQQSNAQQSQTAKSLRPDWNDRSAAETLILDREYIETLDLS